MLEDEFDTLVPDDASNGAGGHSVPANGPKADSMSSRIVQLLGTHPSKRFDAATVAAELGITNLNSLRGTLLRLASTKYIQKAGRGGFQAKKGTAM